MACHSKTNGFRQALVHIDTAVLSLSLLNVFLEQAVQSYNLCVSYFQL